MTSQVAQDLRAAAEVLKRDGWVQGKYHDGKGCHCALGAMAVVISGKSARPNPDRWKSWSEFSERLSIYAEVVTRSFSDRLSMVSLANWNDTPGRTADEVIAALEAAADAAEAQQ